MIKAVAIDDEPVALTILQQHAIRISFMQPLQTFVSAVDALAFIKKEDVQLVFLDINMPDISGIEFAQLIDKQTAIIFTTAYPEFAIKGFELAAVDYLLKPINFSRFLTACQRVHDRLEDNKTNKQYFFVKDGYEWIKIDFATILFAEADSNYITIYKTAAKTITRMTLTELAEKLPSDNFMRISKSVIIAIDKIEKVEKNYVVIVGKEVRISDNYREAFFKKIM